MRGPAGQKRTGARSADVGQFRRSNSRRVKAVLASSSAFQDSMLAMRRALSCPQWRMRLQLCVVLRGFSSPRALAGSRAGGQAGGRLAGLGGVSTANLGGL
jgi:hypothetical protein